MELWQIDIGGTVVCDFCNEDYTESGEVGGLIFEGYAVCPKCEKPELIKDADYVCRDGESFKHFILRVRENNIVGVYSW